MEPNTRKPVSPGIKALLEFGPLLVFFVAFSPTATCRTALTNSSG